MKGERREKRIREGALEGEVFQNKVKTKKKTEGRREEGGRRGKRYPVTVH